MAEPLGAVSFASFLEGRFVLESSSRAFRQSSAVDGEPVACASPVRYVRSARTDGVLTAALKVGIRCSRVGVRVPAFVGVPRRSVAALAS